MMRALNRRTRVTIVPKLVWLLTLAMLAVPACRPSMAFSPMPKQNAAENGKASVAIVRVPDGGLVPDVVMEESGTLHLVYGKNGEAYYAQSRDGGATFLPSVKLNTRPGTVTVGGERGPKLALGKNGVIHVVWQGHYQKGGGIWVTRSVDGGQTFAAERNVLDTKTGIDMPTLTADREGNVIVLWLDGRMPETPENKVSSPLFMARSTDNGATFGANTALKTDFPGRGCACCMLWGRIVGKELYIAFRTGYQDIRDMYLLRGAKNGNDFHATRVSVDNWKFEGCPMSGPRFAVLPTYVIGSAGGQETAPPRHLLLAWMSQNKVYWTYSENSGETFAPRLSAPGGGDGNYPMVVGNGKGEILLVWTRGKKAHWAVYRAAASEPKAQGVAGEAQGRPTVFLRSDGTFALVL